MNDNDVIKELEELLNKVGYRSTEWYMSLSNALLLINRLQAENERLAEENKDIKGNWGKVKTDQENTCKECRELFANAKSEARKEFADKLKLDAKVYDEYDGEEEYFYMYVTVEDIDNLLKELNGEEHSE